MKKKLLRIIPALVLMAALLSVSVAAIADVQPTPIAETVTLEGHADSDELFARYVENLFSTDASENAAPFSTGSHTAGSRLTGDAKVAYDALVPFVKQVAAGKRTSTSFEFDPNHWPTFPLSEYQAKIRLVVDALYADFPHEMYWCDLYNRGYQYWRMVEGDQVSIVQIDFAVGSSYATKNLYEVNTAKTAAPARALANARTIVSNNQSRSDQAKLEAYIVKISDLVDYNYQVYLDDDTTCNDPWQIIWVFDGDPSTDVVCEGYAKAYQYLCDLSTWNGDVQCYSVIGLLNDELHMWNIVSVDGVNYLTDPTGCDNDTAGSYDKSYFMQFPVSGSVANGYQLSNGNLYTYNSRTIWGTDILTLARPVAITTQPKSVTVAKGATAKVTVGATGEGLSYTWYVKAEGKSSFTKSSITGKTYSVAMTDARNGNQLYCVVKDKHGFSVRSNTVTIKMSNPVTITAQPKSVTVAKGAAAKVTVSATGEGLTYAWYVKPVGKTSFSRSSITGNTYSVAMTATRNGNQLYCVVKDKYGNSVKTNTVTIKMSNPVTITAQPKSVTVGKGATAKLTVSATGEGLTYAWYLKAVGKTSFSRSSITGNTYSVAMTATRNGNQLYCVVKDKYGNSVKTNTVTIKMSNPVTITAQPKSVTVGKGATAKLTVSATGEGLTYAWYLKAVGKNTFNKSSVTGNVYSVEMTAARNGNQLYCVVKDKYGNSVKTNTVTIQMIPSVAITTQPKSVTVAKGETAKLTVSATGDSLTYAWYLKAVGKTTFSRSTVTGNVYSVEMTAARNGNQLYCVAKDKYGNTAKTETVTIKMAVPGAMVTQPDPETAEEVLAIENTDPQTVNLTEGGMHTMSVTATGGTMPYSYQWYVNKGRGYEAVEGATNATYTTSPVSHSTSGYSYYCVVTDGNGNTVTGPVYTVLVSGEDAAPATGDSSLVELWAVLCVVSAGACLLLMKRRKSER